ncbi:hypothetical protein [Amycolatopsis sp. 195334CR]|uniref:hypothetical protein n=1 Tax=Amycolatopsis sp. 195334CR TaxID=2814588 RepID=UPI001A8D42FA|nr:hypothetical protein [Amycolatopsis sp. 195334CR]MBN6035332.1 hypothetical protein [Amycolatopsis sp. 195334CR]
MRTSRRGHQYKVTKYGEAHDPEEWTAYSDIGELVDRAEYERVEGLYLQAVRTAAELSGVTRVRVRGLEGEDAAIREGQWLSLDEAVEVCRAMLREAGIWCRLEDDDRFYAHVGNDFYLYVGSTVDAHRELAGPGLFVEPNWPSPYREE